MECTSDPCVCSLDGECRDYCWTTPAAFTPSHTLFLSASDATSVTGGSYDWTREGDLWVGRPKGDDGSGR